MSSCVYLATQGRIFYDPSLSNLTPEERRELFVAMTVTLSRLHSINWKGCGLEGYGSRGDYCSRQVSLSLSLSLSLTHTHTHTLTQVSVWSNNYLMASSEPERPPEVQQLMEWLKTHIPHGEHHLGIPLTY